MKSISRRDCPGPSGHAHCPIAPERTRVALAVLTALVALGAQPMRAHAQDPAASAASPQRIVITGTNIKRVDVEGALPVTTISRKEIERSGLVTVADLLKALPQSGSGTLTQATTQGGFTPGCEAVALRGLSANATLVLLNGRRLPTYPLSGVDSSCVNLDQIPSSAIERIELLKDAASSIYGSDAVAGVVNFITRKNYQGFETSLRYGDAQRQHPREITASVTAGFGDLQAQGLNGFATFEHLDRTAMFKTDRDWLSSSNTKSRGGYDRRLPYSSPSNAVDANTGAYLVSPACPANRVSGGLCYTDFADFSTVVPKSRRDSLAGGISFDLAKSVQLFAEVLVGREESSNRFSPDLLVGTNVIAAGTAGNPFGTTVVPFGLIPGAPSRVERIVTDNHRIVLGARGAWRDADWELAATEGQSKSRQTFANQLYAAATDAGLSSGAISPFGTVNNDPARLQALLGTSHRNAKTQNSELDGRASSPLFELPAGPLDASAGFSVRREKLNDATDADVTTTFISGVDYGTNRGSRTIGSLYAEAVVPVLRSLSMQLSARHDHFSDFGNTTNPKLGLRWQAVPDLLLVRASAATGFRAPSLSQITIGSAAAFANGNVDPIRCPVTGSSFDCGGGSFNLIQGGNPDIKPEKSKSWSLGGVWQISREIDFTADYFNIDYKNEIRTLDVDTILADETTTTGSLVVRAAPSQADIAQGIPGRILTIKALPLNLGRSRVSGWDFELRARLGAGDWGRFSLSSMGTYMVSQREQADPTSDWTSTLDSYNNPRLKLLNTLDWTYGAFNTRLTHRYSQGYRDSAVNTLTRKTERVGEFTQLDALVSWEVLRNATVSVGVNNLFDERSPFSAGAGSGNASNGDLIGRAYYVALRYAFR